MKNQFKVRYRRFKEAVSRRIALMSIAIMCFAMSAVPAFASSTPDADFVVDPAAFDGMFTGITANLGAVLPKVLMVVGILIGISIPIYLVRKNARPN